MAENDVKKIFCKKLNHYLNIREETQKGLADAIGVSTSTVNDWCKGKSCPRMGKIDAICNHFGILRSDLLTEKAPQDDGLKGFEWFTALSSDGQQKVKDFAAFLLSQH